MKKSIAAHLCTVSDFAIDMFDVLDAINYQSYNDFVLRVGECRDSRAAAAPPPPWALAAGKLAGNASHKRPRWPPGSSSEPGLTVWAPLCRVSCSRTLV